GDREFRRLAEAFADGARPHVFDVHRLAVDLAGLLVAADYQDRRNVEPGRRHQVARGSLVAAGEADHAVEQRGFDLHLDVVGDDVAPGKDIAAAFGRTGDEVRRRRRTHFERHAAGGA